MSPSRYLDYSKFYRLRDPLASRPLRLSDRGYSEWVTMDQLWLLARGRLELDEPLRLGAYQGGQVADFLWAGLVLIVCISRRVTNLLTEQNVTGWTTYPVDIYDRQGQPVPGYQGLAVTGPECHLDKSRSQIVTNPPPVPRGREHQVYKGLYFDESQWDGSDMFRIRNAGIVVTEKVYRLLRKNKATNLKLIPLTEAERDVHLDRFDE